MQTRLSGVTDGERGSTFIMKRAEAHISGAAAAELDEVTDNFNNVGRIEDSSYCIVINSLHREGSEIDVTDNHPADAQGDE